MIDQIVALSHGGQVCDDLCESYGGSSNDFQRESLHGLENAST